MKKFSEVKINKQLLNALQEKGFDQMTPIQEAAYSPILAGQDFVGIAQTGTGKTIAYLLPILQDLNYTNDLFPRVLILVPTRELVIQIMEDLEKLTEYIDVRICGVYGGTNINTQKKAINNGIDIIVGNPQRLYDLALSGVLRLKTIKKLVIDEVDIMLDFGYKTQLNRIFEHLPNKRQNLLFSATMTDYVDVLINEFLVNPIKKTISLSGTPLDKITQQCYKLPNFYSKVNLLNHILQDKERYKKVLIFVSSKVNAKLLFESLVFDFDMALIHSSKAQNQRAQAIENFDSGNCRILIATDVIARGIDIEKISTVISFNIPNYAENYIHRIGRTGRAGEQGESILLFSDKEQSKKDAIERLMNYTIPVKDIPGKVSMSAQLTAEEKSRPLDLLEQGQKQTSKPEYGSAYHEKSSKNSKTPNAEKSYARKMKSKYKKPIKRGDKIQNLKKRKRK